MPHGHALLNRQGGERVDYVSEDLRVAKRSHPPHTLEIEVSPRGLIADQDRHAHGERLENRVTEILAACRNEQEIMCCECGTDTIMRDFAMPLDDQSPSCS